MSESLSQFFARVTGNKSGILPYQERYGSNPFVSTLLIIPTGLGKTDAVLVPWLFAHAYDVNPVPARLILVLPRQNLTGQVARIARKRVEAAGLTGQVRVLELMAGSGDNADTISPSQPAIVVCTQDMYFSRALNRGYARRPPRWPIDFALFNNDSLLVFDEVQLMSDALATSAQLASLRRSFGCFGEVTSIWMSATLEPSWLDTVDFREQRPGVRVIQLDERDHANEIVAQRFRAVKRLRKAPDECSTPEGCAAFAIRQHQPRERTLVMTNTVSRAREVYSRIRSQFQSTVLLHSRFRPADRRQRTLELDSIPDEGQIVVSTQVLEAGIDITAHRLITDLASWGSLVQRFGRVNRFGELSGGADIWWVDLPLHGKVKPDDIERLYAPYDVQSAELARSRLARLSSASPEHLPAEDGPAPWTHVIRKTDLLDLFDTSPDLSGNEIDVSRFIRSGEDRDVYIAWRQWDGDAPPEDMPELTDEELCPAPINEVREFLRKHALFKWNFALEVWERADREKLLPGMLLLAHVAEGGYSVLEGWKPDSKAPVDAVATTGDSKVDGDSDDRLSFRRYRQSLVDHMDQVVHEMKDLLDALEPIGIKPFRPELERAAALHDWGKAHPVMQQTLRGDEAATDLLAKSQTRRKHARPHFRHELASALAMIATGESELAAFVAASHHGRVRLSIRSMPREPDQTARGIREGDVLPACRPATGVSCPEVTLSLDPMKMGLATSESVSWTDRVLGLLGQLGPFRLAYLEMLLRAADERASARQPEAAICGQ
jgi:CRISPR-associated endonuclease/helicase Cas3